MIDLCTHVHGLTYGEIPEARGSVYDTGAGGAPLCDMPVIS